MSSLPERLKMLRLEHHHTQSDIAQMLQCGVSGVSSYESGARTPNYEILLKYASFFHVTTDYLLGNTGVSEAPERNYLDVTGLPDADVRALETLVHSLKRK